MSQVNDNGYLYLVLSPRLSMLIQQEQPEGAFVVDGTRYAQIDTGQWEGFYDWLRPDGCSVNGCRFWAWEHVASILEATMGLHYCDVDDKRSVCVFFSPDHSFDASISDDQDFAFSKVYRSDGGIHLLVVSLVNLSPSEMEVLRSSPFRGNTTNQ